MTLTAFLVGVKRSCPLLWQGVESVNSWLMRLRYPGMRAVAAAEVAALNARRGPRDLSWSLVEPADAVALSEFLSGLGEERMAHFHPHAFDSHTLARMARGHSFVMLKVTGVGGRVVGYHFLRCFFTGRTFHGLAVAREAGGRGIGGEMWALGARIARRCGMRMRATISESNQASLRSCRRATRCTILSRLPDGYLLVECNPKER